MKSVKPTKPWQLTPFQNFKYESEWNHLNVTAVFCCVEWIIVFLSSHRHAHLCDGPKVHEDASAPWLTICFACCLALCLDSVSNHVSLYILLFTFSVVLYFVYSSKRFAWASVSKSVLYDHKGGRSWVDLVQFMHAIIAFVLDFCCWMNFLKRKSKILS